MTYLVYEKSFEMFVHEDKIPKTLGKCSTDKISIPGSKILKPVLITFKYNLPPCSKTLLNVIFDHEDSGMFRAVRNADKVIKARCLPLELTLKRSSP